MNTSTPFPERNPLANRDLHNVSAMAASPLRRRSVLQTPIVVLENVNDEKERSSRRSFVDIQRRLSNIPRGVSPLNESHKFLGEQDMKDHFQICTRLFTENKITPKNAWKLHIIDLLKDMAQKTSEDVLQVAGTSLDISAKVYSIRVDDIHSDGMKLASSMSRVTDKELPHDSGDIDNEGEADKENVPDKRKKKKRTLLTGKKNTICKDPKTLQAPLPKLESVVFSTRTDAESSAIDNLFTNKLKMDNSGYKFMLLSCEKAWTEQPDPVVQGLNASNRKKYPLMVDPLPSVKLCAPFKDFELDEWDPDEEEKQLASQKSSFMEYQQDVVFDEDGVPMHELDGSIHDIFENAQDDDVESVHEEVVPQIRGDIAKIVEFQPNLTSGTYKSEYSYNTVVPTYSGKLIDQIWAGPSHWKLKFIRRSSVRFSGQVTQQTKQAKMGRKKKQPEMINYDVEFEEFDMNNKLKIKRKPPTADFHKITLPVPDSSCIKLMEHIQELMTKPGVCPVKKKPAGEKQLEYEVSGYKYQNPNDSQYCSQHSSDPDVNNPLPDGDDNDFDDGDQVEEHQVAQQEFLGENLVDAPEEVPKSYVPYALQAKKMNMKKLKAAVWQIVTNTPVNLIMDPQEKAGKVIPTTFSKMFKELPNLLPQKMQKELSCSLAFVALLHLCNEQNLKLIQHPGYKDFDINGPEFYSTHRKNAKQM
ncbi:hypothetical protein NQ315_007678 [Exocentrus adspersus]|uniref:Condensin complex subunit 2 n=1 Tax=Exocentrus adspersus TaxID=1586481 RepID=A0AAV8WA31_9CUCU|nr:hypothetical protein NQ315_007678 [Exocentrus adspersus]